MRLATTASYAACSLAATDTAPLRQGLFDEFRIGLTPHILGGGTSLFNLRPERLKLQLLDAKPLSTGIVILRYAPAK